MTFLNLANGAVRLQDEDGRIYMLVLGNRVLSWPSAQRALAIATARQRARLLELEETE